jgi:hypothetical protein
MYDHRPGLVGGLRAAGLVHTGRGTQHRKGHTLTSGQKDAECLRLQAMRDGTEDRRRWGPYVGERQWGTVREDYSEGGTAWNYLPRDHARSRAYRWGEDGLAGFCDDRQPQCISLALWNERDPILKERLFGLTNQQGDHGEDVKELHYYLDADPSHAYNRMLYKLLQTAYAYQWLIDENARRKGTSEPEFELIDTGLFDEDRYFDVEVEYARAAPGRPATARTASTTLSFTASIMPSIPRTAEARLPGSIVAWCRSARAQRCVSGCAPTALMHQTSRDSTDWSISAGLRRTHSARRCSPTSRMTICGSCSVRPCWAAVEQAA